MVPTSDPKIKKRAYKILKRNKLQALNPMEAVHVQLFASRFSEEHL